MIDITERADKKTLDTLVTDGVIDKGRAADVLKINQQTKEPLGRLLLTQKIISEKELVKAIAKQIPNLIYMDLEVDRPSDEMIHLIPQQYAKGHKAVAVKQQGDELYVALIDPLDLYAIDDLSRIMAKKVKPVASPPSQIETYLSEFDLAGGSPIKSGSIAEEIDKLGDMSGGRTLDIGDAVDLSEAGKIREVEKDANEPEVIRAVNVLIKNAIDSRASDIHLTPMNNGKLVVQYRIDGILHDIFTFPNAVRRLIITRIKVMSDIDISKSMVPNDGRMSSRYKGNEYDFRISTIPTIHGENVVMRKLEKTSRLIGLDKLGLFPETQEALKKVVNLPNGMFLDVGPTGSGKTTTLYSILTTIYTPEKNFLTIEEPVEYTFEGVKQVQVNRKAGVDFDNMLKYFLRHDPDVIMVGEIRDKNTADIAIQAALTGHLVLSTLHTNDAPGAVTRLLRMEVEPVLIADCVKGVLSQRLGRRVCQDCAKEYQEPPGKLEAIQRMIHFKLPENPIFYKGQGCSKCLNTGYYERIGVFEFMAMDLDLREIINKRAPPTEVYRMVLEKGMVTMMDDGVKKALKGLTTIDEVLRVVPQD